MSEAVSLEGLLPLDKPSGPSSHDMVTLTRRSLGTRRVGHTGTLDPLASGLLLMCLGRSTRLAEYLQSFRKDYVALARLGASTTTDDLEGDIASTSEAWRSLVEREVQEALGAFVGTSEQRPPAFSAKKVRGTPAYRRARRGEALNLSPIPVVIDRIELEGLDLPELRFRVRCSTGTYVRSLVRDLGERLGVGAHLTQLRRVAIGPFRVEDALTPEALLDPVAVAEAIVSPLDAVSHLPRLQVTHEEALRLQSGQTLSIDDQMGSADGEHAVAFGHHLLAVAVRSGSEIKPKKVFALD